MGAGDRTVDWHTNVPAGEPPKISSAAVLSTRNSLLFSIGTVVFFSVTDAEGQFGRSADFVVQPSGTSCSSHLEYAAHTKVVVVRPETDDSSCL